MRIFIGSSGEEKAVVDWVTRFILREYRGRIDPDPWTGSWKAGHSILENLLEYVDKTDASILFWTPDDKVEFRKNIVFKPRDNLIFEAGLFIAAHGKERTHIMIPEFIDESLDESLKVTVPADVLGLNFNLYPWREKAREYAATGLPSTTREVCEILLGLGPRPGRRSSFFQDLSKSKNVEEVSTLVGKWQTIHTEAILELAK